MSDCTFYQRWILANGWAESAGLGTTFIIGRIAAPTLEHLTGTKAVLAAVFVAVLLGTLLEGIVVGLAQERVLRLIALRPWTWTLATALGAALAWLLGMIPSTVMNLNPAQAQEEALAEPGAAVTRIDAGKIADCLRCDFLPECHMASTAIRDRRRTLRYRHLLVRQVVQMKNRISGLLLETGVSHNRQRLHKVRYFRELLANEEVQESIRPLLRLSRETIVRLQKTEYALVSSLQRDPLLAERIKRLRTVPGVGPITALTWALEMGDVSRFRSIKDAISYCGLCGDEKSSADKVMRTRLSKQRIHEHC